ncbi:hypothetical protein [Arthrobacter oryzae]|uniref:hypothetical protein n=1 Tax=Arthrobacter oryzae TaxID=409290 RepID=UPI00285CF45B|nr:hypothetical protein [Arthrobacter oryzae]MDR6508668.1 hypothetical protein [Arthrobacter oryzae]
MTMDPIKNLIAGTDPLHSDPSGIPDGETALRRMLSEPAAFSDNAAAGIVSLDEARRRRRAKVAGLVTIAAAAVAVGVLVAGNLGALTSAPEPAGTVAATESAAPTPTPSATSTPTPSPTPTPTPSAAAVAWTKFTDTTGQATFEHPVGWSVTEDPHTIAGGPYNTIRVNNADGKTVSTLAMHYEMVVGYTCPVPKPVFTLDSVIVDIPQKAAKRAGSGPSEFAFRVIQSDKVYGTMALNDADPAPETTACALYSSIISPEKVPPVSFGDTWSLQQDGKDAPLTFASLAEAQAYTQTQEYRDIKRMLISLELRAVNKPVEWKSYTSGNGLGTFEYPENWTVAGRENGRYSDVVNASGRTVLTLGFNQTRNTPNLISPCPPFTILDSAPMSFPSNRQGERAIPPQFIFRVWDVTKLAGDSATFVANLGIADESWGVDGTTCDPQNVVSGLSSGEYFFAQNYNTGAATDLKFSSMEEARAYMESEEFKTLKRIVMSLKING